MNTETAQPVRLAPLMGAMALLAAVILAPASASAAERWQELKSYIVGDGEILDGRAAGVIDIEAPARAHDAAVVPVVMKALMPQSDDLYIRRLYLVVDNNPLPLAGTFNFEGNNGWATIETRIRINEYTDVRVVAQTSDDRLYMASTFVKAAGGCSAPALGDMEAAMARMGAMKFFVDDSLVAGQPATAQVLLSHPNNSGMQFDQISRNYIPAHFVHKIGIEYNDRKIVDIDTNFSMSENPSVYFTFVPGGDGQITVRAVDSKENVFEKSWPIDTES